MKLYTVTAIKTETVEFDVLAESEDEAVKKYKKGDYIDGYEKNDYEYKVVKVTEESE